MNGEAHVKFVCRYCECADNSDLKLQRRSGVDLIHVRARQEVRAHFRSSLPAGALFAANDVGAYVALDSFRHDLGISVPAGIKVIGFDNIMQSG